MLVNNGGKMKIKINKNTLLWVLIGVLAVLVIYTLFFRGMMGGISLGRNAGQAASAYSGMVGGC